MVHLADTLWAGGGPDGSGGFSASRPPPPDPRSGFLASRPPPPDPLSGFSASRPPPPDPCSRFSASRPPPPDPRSGHGVDSPSDHLPARDRHTSRGTSRRPPSIRSTEGERNREHQHHRSCQRSRSPGFCWPLRESNSRSTEGEHRHLRSCDETGHSARFRSPLRGSNPRYTEGERYMRREHRHLHPRDETSHSASFRSPLRRSDSRSTQGERYWEHQHHCTLDESSRSSLYHSSVRGSKLVPLLERHQLEDSNSLPSSKRYQMEGRCKGSSSDSRQYNYLGGMEMSPWDDGYVSPTSPTYCCDNDNEQYVQRGSYDHHQDETPGLLDSTSRSCSGIAGREPYLKCEDPVLKTETSNFAYGALVDDFMDAVLKGWHSPPNKTVDEEAHQKQTNRFAELALKHYNKNNKVKYSLVEATVGSVILEGTEIYAHVNFYAKAKNGPKKDDAEVLVFAELHQIGRRLNAMVLTCFQLLDENNQICGRGDQVQRSRIVQDQDMRHCYACSYIIKHPDGICYKAGHSVDPLCYHHN